ncbi:diguanylate cyclase domain-containing protein [Aestuariibacter salexigens]|uniref:GGDEF domain-containing response regulator n=1 Tax=Aestuariibacter salexigens TaxID=226010 RepID=UPI0003F84B5C|nr:diguanylate cyclase [Aestuariibacter salexigens]
MAADPSKATVLIVDDEKVNLHILAQGLSQEHHVLFAESGKQAIKFAHEQLPDLILLDIDLPDMNGYDVLRRLKDDPETMKIPIIFITGHDSDEDELHGLELGAVDYFTKPFKMALAKVRINNQLDLKRKTDLLEQLASIDGLTGIPNRRDFDQTLENEWRRAMRSSSALGLVMIDIDFFKQFNDHYGHAKGDACLKRVASKIDSIARRAGEFAARYGGEEFVVLLPGANEAEVTKMAERVRAGVEKLAIKHEYSGCSEVVTVSAGTASCVPDKLGGQTELLQRADDNLYAAKEEGRNRVISSN